MKEKEIEITFTVNERQFNMFKDYLQKELTNNISAPDKYVKDMLSARAWRSILYCTKNRI